MFMWGVGTSDRIPILYRYGAIAILLSNILNYQTTAIESGYLSVCYLSKD